MDILPQLLVNSLISGSMYALASAGLALSYGLLRILNFAHGQIIMLGAYLFYLFFEQYQFNLFLSSIFTIFSTICLSIFIVFIFVFPFLRYNYILPLITTLALATILESTVAMLFGVNVKSFTLPESFSSIEIWGIYITPLQILIILSTIILLSIVAFIIHSTSVGRKIRALSEQPHAAEAIGIRSTKIRVSVFTIATLIAVYAGILVGFETNLQPTMGNYYTIKAFAAMILGGLGNIWGTVIGSYLLGLIENLSIGLDFGSYSIPAGYKDAFAFMIILLVLLFRPQGIFNSRSRSV